MFKLLIVDDEENIRNGLKKFIHWQEFDIHSVVTAKNGLEALELAREDNPDIVICDVRMPKMDGIEFSKELKELLPNCILIFLSGYADKEYLKAAIQLKALNYIEKPVNINEVKSTISSAISQLKEERNQKNNYEQMQKTMTYNLHIMRQEIALELLKEHVDPAALLEKYGQPAFNLPLEGYFTTASILLNWNSSIDNERKKAMSNMLLKLLNDDLCSLPVNHLAGFLNYNNIILISEGLIDLNLPKSQNILESSLKLLTDAADNQYTVSIGCGSPVQNIRALYESFQYAKSVETHQFYKGVGKVFYSNLTSGNSINISKSEFSQFKDLLKKDKFEQAEKFISYQTEKISESKDPDIDKIRKVYFNFMLILFENSKEFERMDLHEESQNDVIWQEIISAPTLNNISELVKKYIKTAVKTLDEADIYNKKIYEIMKFIQENYFESTLSTKTISEQSYLTQTYLCTFFKKYTGKTLNDYITEFRLEKAKELLKDDNLKLYEVAANVGYSDAHYFSMLFKRQFGCLPTEFRKRF